MENLNTLALKLEHVFKNHLTPLATKNRIKTQEEDKAFKMATNVLADFEPQLSAIFQHFSGKPTFIKSGKKDATILVHQVIEMLNIAKLLDPKSTDLTLEEVIFMIEKYNDPEQILKTQLSDECFQSHLDANPELIPATVQASYRAS